MKFMRIHVIINWMMPMLILADTGVLVTAFATLVLPLKRTTTTSSTTFPPAVLSFSHSFPDHDAGAADASSSSSVATTSSSPLPTMPFFAATSTTSSSSSAAANTVAATTVTQRLPLGTIFDGREYIFVTESNVRSYEWTIRECDLLFDDLMDAAALSFMETTGAATTTHDNAAATTATSNNNNNNAMITDYELSQIVIVPTSDWDANIFGLGSRYDVYDGQQRLVTLNLLLASLRDSFHVEAEELHHHHRSDDAGGGARIGGKRAVALSATAREIAGMLVPVKVRKADVRRITLRKRDDVLLERILMGGTRLKRDDETNIDDADYREQEDCRGDNNITTDQEEDPLTSLLPSKTYQYPQMSSQQKTLLLSALSPANARIFHNFVHLSQRLSALSTRERLRLLDYVVERVHLLVCVPETSRIARNIVLNQQGRRKGMDNEPIDDFKGLVCFRYTLEEEEMYRTFDAWDVLLAADTTAIAANAKVVTASPSRRLMMTKKSVGREIVSSACLLRASAALRTRIRSSRDRGGGDEVYELERWLRRELTVRNNQRASSLATTKGTNQHETMKMHHEYWQGKDFFVEEIEPASIALHKFRAGLWDEFDFLSKTGTKKEDNGNVMTKKQRDATIARLNFLRDITLGVTAANEAEIVVLEYLVRAERASRNEDKVGTSRNLDEILPVIEKWALWMAVTRPSSLQRQSRIFALLDAMDDTTDSGGGMLTKSSTGDIEKKLGTSLREAMNEYEFGASAVGKRLATAILKRLNSHLMIEEKKNIPDGSIITPTVESILLSDWTSEEERDEWANRIGNMVLVSSSAPRTRSSRANKNGDLTWENRRKRYNREPWVMTRQVADCEQWDANAIKDQQRDILSLVELVWSFESA